MTASPASQRSAVEGTDTHDPQTVVNPLTGKQITVGDTYRPVHAFDNVESNTRTYIHPRTGESFTSVTTALGIIEKYGLLPWYAKLATLDAVSHLDQLNAAARSGNVSCDDQWCGKCLTCLIASFRKAPERERDAAADRGTRFHHLAEIYALTGQIIGHDDDLKLHVANFLDFIRVHQVTVQAAEVTVLHRGDGWGGTLDGVITCGWMPPKHRELIGVPLMADYKTSNHIFAQAGLQLAAYNNAECALLDDGSEHPLPPAHPDVALSLQINDKGWWVRPCPTTDQAYAKFRRILEIWRDLNEPDLDLVERAMYKPRAKTTATTTDA
jgi:hypothetical protein